MKKILLFFTFLITTLGFGQFNSDREAYLSLLNKLQKDPKRIYENSSSTISSSVNFKMVNGEEKLISLRINDFDNTQVQNIDSTTIDITNELKQFNLSESLEISAYANFKTTGFKNTYQIDFHELSNLINLKTFSFKGGISEFVELKVINLNKINNLNKLETLGLYSLKMDNHVNTTLESTTQYKIKEFSISPFKENNEFITNFNFSSFKNSLEKLTIEGFRGDLNNDFFSNLPYLKVFTHIGSFGTFPSNLSNSQNLQEMVLESYSGFTTLPSQLSNLTNLKSLTIRTNQLQLPSTLNELKNLKSFEIRQSLINGLEPLEKVNSLENLTVFFYNANKKSLDLQNLNNLKKLIYKYDPSQLVDLHPKDYSLPNAVEKLTNLEYLDISVSDLPCDIKNLVKLKRLHIEYINDDLFPKIDFSNNINLEYLTLNRFFNDYNTNVLKTSRIKFDKEFEKLTNLSWIDFWNVPIEMDVTNKFNKLFNATHPDPNVTLLKYFAFNNLKSNIPNKLDGILNICNNQDIYLDIQGSSPNTIDYRNKSLNYSPYFFLDLKDTDNPLIIVDDVNKFKQTFGETYYNSTTNTDVAYNLIISTEPCERTLSTTNLTKSNIKIYPNPVVDVLNIETESNQNSIKILNITGEIIDSYTINNKKISIITNHLSKGIYIVEIENEKGKTISKFIKK